MLPLLFKLIFAPIMLATTSLVGRRWGSSVGGSLAAIPVVAGSICFFVSLDQGAAFGSHTAVATLVGMGTLAWFCLGYSYASRRFGWPASLGLAYLLVLAGAVAVIPFSNAPGVAALLFTLTTLVIAYRLLPPAAPAARLTPPTWDIPARMATSAALIVGLTALAQSLGPQLSGLLAAAPMNFTVLLVFTHRHEGAERARGVIRGFVAGLVSTCLFLEVVADGVVPLGVGAAFALAVAVCVGYQVFAIARLRREARFPASEAPSGA